MKNFANKLVGKMTVKGMELKDKVSEKMKEKNGSFFTENALVIVITVVIAAIIITAVILLLKGTIFPQLNDKVDEFFALS